MPPISITTNGIINLLCNLDPNKAMGPDKISLYILKYFAAEISLNTGKLLSDWLRANVYLVYKKGNRTRSSPSNYNQFFYVPAVRYVLEHIIFHSVMDHLQLYIYNAPANYYSDYKARVPSGKTREVKHHLKGARLKSLVKQQFT